MGQGEGATGCCLLAQGWSQAGVAGRSQHLNSWAVMYPVLPALGATRAGSVIFSPRSELVGIVRHSSALHLRASKET